MCEGETSLSLHSNIYLINIVDIWLIVCYLLSVSMLHGLRRQCFLPVTKQNFKFSVTFMLSSANAFNLDEPKILSFCTIFFSSHRLLSHTRTRKRHWNSGQRWERKKIKWTASGLMHQLWLDCLTLYQANHGF